MDPILAEERDNDGCLTSGCAYFLVFGVLDILLTILITFLLRGCR